MALLSNVDIPSAANYEHSKAKKILLGNTYIAESSNRQPLSKGTY